MTSRRYTRQAVEGRRRRRDEQLRRELDRPVHLTASGPDVHTASLFGSMARGDTGEHSDPDRAVVMDSPDPFLGRVGDAL